MKKMIEISQIMLNLLLGIVFCAVLPFLKLMNLIFRQRKNRNSPSNWLEAGRDAPFGRFLTGTKWSPALWACRKRKYEVTFLSLILGILAIFFSKNILKGKISDSIYELH